VGYKDLRQKDFLRFWAIFAQPKRAILGFPDFDSFGGRCLLASEGCFGEPSVAKKERDFRLVRF
jgi:hypothetical protein